MTTPNECIDRNAWNENVSAKTETWFNYKVLSDFADELASLSNQSLSYPSLGKWSNSASSFVLQFTNSDSLGHIEVLARISSGDYEPYRSEASIRFLTDPASIDQFAHEISSSIQLVSGSANLRGIK